MQLTNRKPELSERIDGKINVWRTAVDKRGGHHDVITRVIQPAPPGYLDDLKQFAKDRGGW